MRLRDIAAYRLRCQRLTGESFASAAHAVRSLVAVQSQDFAGAKWGLAQRTRADTDATIAEAFDRGALLRTHVLRPTWHFVAPEDIRWLLALTAPRVHAAMAYSARKRDLDARVLGRACASVARALEEHGAQTREELGEALARRGVEAKGERLGHVLMHAELEALVCSGPRRGKQHTYALLDERVPKTAPRDRDDALAELARRYFAGHGPGLARDLAWWSGLTLADARRGIAAAEAHLTADVVDEETFWRADDANIGSVRSARSLCLLPNYDEYVVAYRDRRAFLDESIAGGFPREMMLANHVVVRDGRIVGTWRRDLEKNAVSVEVRLFAALDAGAKRALEAAVAAFGRFLSLPATLRVAARARDARDAK